MNRMKVPLRQSATKQEVFKFYGWDIHDPDFNKRYRNLKSTAKGIWDTVLKGVFPGASIENQRTSRLGVLRPHCFALTKEKLWEKFEGQAAERMLLGDGKGLIDHVVYAAQRDYWDTNAGKMRMRVWRQKLQAIADGEASALIGHDETDREIVDCHESSTPLSYPTFSMLSNSAIEVPQMHTTRTNLPQEVIRANGSPTPSSHLTFSLISGEAGEVPEISGSDASLPRDVAPAKVSVIPNPLDEDHSMSTSKSYFVITDSGFMSSPLPSSNSGASSSASNLPSFGDGSGNLTNGHVWEPTLWASPSYDDEGYTPNRALVRTSDVPSFHSLSAANGDTRSPHGPTTDRPVASVGTSIQDPDPLPLVRNEPNMAKGLSSDARQDGRADALSDVEMRVDGDIDWSSFIDELLLSESNMDLNLLDHR